jgi:hypothetical protein
MRVLELGTYIAPAYAGMVLAEQGHDVIKAVAPEDPIRGLNMGADLWRWLSYRKALVQLPLGELADALPVLSPDVVIDNLRPATLARHEIDPVSLSEDRAWVSLRADVGDTSFDVIAQARSWMEYGPWMPFYLGDTCAGLWLAFKALSLTASEHVGHHVIGHAACLQKLVEGELQIDVTRDGKTIPWDVETYTGVNGCAEVEYRGRVYREPIRERDWKLANLRHVDGRIVV